MADATRTLLDALQEQFPDSSKTTLRQMLQGDRVRVNGDIERDAKREIGPRDRVEVGGKMQREKLDSRVVILHEDPHIVVINKASGLLTTASPVERERTAEAFLNRYYKAAPGESRVHVVHRLDRDASGVLVFARNTHMRDRLQNLFAGHDLERIYVAIIEGAMPRSHGTIRSFLLENGEKRVEVVSRETKGAKEAITHYRTLNSGNDYSMLELKLETGRRNQIRVHLAEEGHPIIGDTMYGNREVDPLDRLALHATKLAFVHPATKKEVEFVVPTPQSFRKLKL